MATFLHVPAPSLITGSLEAIENAFLDHLQAAREHDPLAPIDVIVGTVLLRPYLQRLVAVHNGGLLNIRFTTIGELGVRLGEHSLATTGRRPLPAIGERAYAGEIARGTNSYFAPVADTSGFADAARRLVRELRQEAITPDALTADLPAIAESEEKGASLADLYARYLDGRKTFYDADDALRDADIERFDGTQLVLYGVWRVSALGRSLLEGVAARVPMTVFLPAFGSSADSAHAELREWLAGLGAEEAHIPTEDRDTTLAHLQSGLFTVGDERPPDDTAELVSAPDPLSEAREAARQCLQWAREGIPFREMAVSYRQAEVYAPLVEAVFGEAKIPVYVHDGWSLAERPLGRRILALLDLVDSSLRRRDVMAFLSDGGLPKEARERYGGAPVGRWDLITRRAGIVEGLAQWQERLAKYREETIQRAAQDGAPDWLQERAADAEALIRLMAELGRRLAERPVRASWSESLAYVHDLLCAYVRDAEKVTAYLEALRQLDDLVPEVDFVRFLDVVRLEVRNLRSSDIDEGEQGAFGRRGVNVLDVNQLRHLRFRAVAVLGLAERAFPPPPRQDPLLLDDERIRLNTATGAKLPLRAMGADPEPLQFAVAVGSARDRLLLTTRRADEAGGRTQVPSSFFRLAASALAGRRIRIEDVVSNPPPHLRRLAAARVGADTLDRSLTLDERDRTLLELDPPLGVALIHRLEPRSIAAQEALRQRWYDRVLTPYDGIIEDTDGIDALSRVLERWLSATTLETYAECPHRYFLRNILGLEERDEPEGLVRLEAMTRGSLVHDVLEKFLCELATARLDPSQHDGLEKRLMEIANEALDDLERRGLTGMPLLWNVDRQEIIEDLQHWLERELTPEAQGPFTEHAYEVSFGRRLRQERPLDREEPFELTVGGRQIKLAGRIDRLDWTSEKRFRVIDYKTGRVWGNKAPVNGGRNLQLPLYLQAAAWLIGGRAEDGSAEYYYATKRGEYTRISFTGEMLRDRSEEIEGVVERVVSGIGTGDFHLEPGDYCRYCDFNGICPTGKERLRERKSADDRIRSFADMRAVK